MAGMTLATGLTYTIVVSNPRKPSTFTYFVHPGEVSMKKGEKGGQTLGRKINVWDSCYLYIRTIQMWKLNGAF